MKWISTTGGPLVLVPQDAIGLWRGASGEDYALACSVKDYAGVVSWQARNVLVLGDEPLQTAVWDASSTPTLVRWMYAPNEAAIVECLRAEAFGDAIESVRWEPSAPVYALFDSGVEGGSVASPVTMEFKSKHYALNTHIAKAGRDVGVIVHMFQPIGNG